MDFAFACGFFGGIALEEPAAVAKFDGEGARFIERHGDGPTLLLPRARTLFLIDRLVKLHTCYAHLHALFS